MNSVGNPDSWLNFGGPPVLTLTFFFDKTFEEPGWDHRPLVSPRKGVWLHRFKRKLKIIKPRVFSCCRGTMQNACWF